MTRRILLMLMNLDLKNIHTVPCLVQKRKRSYGERGSKGGVRTNLIAGKGTKKLSHMLLYQETTMAYGLINGWRSIGAKS